MFPFRRNGPKKRGKGGGGGSGGGGSNGRRHQDQSGAGRRIPGSAGELLSVMQSSTRALAQMLAGNTKMSGQLAQARTVLAQASRMIEDRLPDRLPPAARDQFFDQLAVLKLTINAADDAAAAEDEVDEQVAKPAVPIDAERLRDVARRLASPDPKPQPPVPPRDDEPTDLADVAPITSGYTLASSRHAADEPQPEVIGTGPRRERLRLKPVHRSAPDSDP